jgi:hypothetical protein
MRVSSNLVNWGVIRLGDLAQAQELTGSDSEMVTHCWSRSTTYLKLAAGELVDSTELGGLVWTTN